MAEEWDGTDDAVVDAAGRAGQRRCEVLAGLCLALTAALVLSGYMRAGAVAQLPDGGFDDVSTWEAIEIAAGPASLSGFQISGVTVLATLVLAYLLVVEIGPGTSIGPVGTRVLQAAVGVGALLTLSAVIATVAALRQPGQIEQYRSGGPFGGGATDTLTAVLDRGGSALPVVVGGGLAIDVAWLASTALIELRRESASARGAEGGQPEGDPDPYGADVDPYGADAD